MKVALITGAGRRFGAYLSMILAERGYAVLMTARHHFAQAGELAAGICQSGGHAAVLKTAVETQAHAAVIAKWATEQSQKWRGKPGLDLLVCNASAYLPTPIASATPADVQDVIGSNLLGPFWLVQSCLPLLRETRGNVVAIADAQIDRAMPGYAIYLAAKSGLRSMMHSLAVECAPEVRINTVSPGVMPWPDGTPQAYQDVVRATIPAGHEGTWHDMAQAVLMFAEASYCTGADLRVDGGWSRVPPVIVRHG